MNETANKSLEIQWVEKSVRLNELKPFEHNPRDISESKYKLLKEKIERLGYRTRIEVNHELKVIGGHQRLRILTELGYDTVQVLVPSRPITDDEFMEAVIDGNNNNGFWDSDILSTFFDESLVKQIDEFTGLLYEKEEAEKPKAAKAFVKCPECEHVFPTKGNKCEVPNEEKL